MWDEEDGFFYDVLRTPDGGATRLKVQSMVGLLPLAAATVFTGKVARAPARAGRAGRAGSSSTAPSWWATSTIPASRATTTGALLAILGEDRLRRVLAHMLDENEFLSPYGIRSLSAKHRDAALQLLGRAASDFSVGYLPAESDSGMFGGNSNWRGPIWMPVNALLIRALLNYYAYYGDDFKVEMPDRLGASA